MKHLLDYLFENLLFESDDNSNGINEKPSDENNKKLKKAAKQIIELLQSKTDLTDYVDTLNKMLKGELTEGEDNTQLHLQALIELFSGQGPKDNKAYTMYNCKGEEDIAVSELYPTQSEIDIENSAKWATKDWGAKGVKDMFGSKGFGASFPVPVLVYNDGKKNWIIDGHHRWSQVALINPEAKLHCMTIEGKKSAQEFLKVTQSIIAGVIAKRTDGKASSEEHPIPVGKAKPDNNIFGDALKGDKLKEKVIEMLNKNKDISKILIKILNEHKKDLDVEKDFDIDTIGELVMKNRDKMIENRQAPEKWAAPRPVMPQSDKAGKTGEEDSGADKEGSALNKLKNVEAFPKLKETK